MKKHAYILMLDIQGFGKLNNDVQSKLIEELYGEVASLLEKVQVPVAEVLDVKTIGDGFLLCFSNQNHCVDVAYKLKSLFGTDYFWTKHTLQQMKCRIALHDGDLLEMEDKIMKRMALFGKSLTSVARLEPAVRENEIWCTESFYSASHDNNLDPAFHFTDIGICELAKGWGESKVWAVHKDNDLKPTRIAREFEEIEYFFRDKSYPHLYFIFMKLADKHLGTEHLKTLLESGSFSKGYSINAVYYIYGDYDVLLGLQSKRSIPGKFIETLLKKKIIKKESDSLVFRVDSVFHQSRAGVRILDGKKREKYSSYQLRFLEPNRSSYFKAFVHLESTKINKPDAVPPFIRCITESLPDKKEFVNYYINQGSLIIEIMFKTSHYYDLSKLIEVIEEYCSSNNWVGAKSITFPIHGFEEGINSKNN